MKAAGFAVFVLGVIVAISAGAKLPPKSADADSDAGKQKTDAESGTVSRFPDTMPWFAAGMVVAGIGLGVWWSVVLSEKAEARSSTEETGVAGESTRNPVELLARLQTQLDSLEGEIASLDVPSLTHRIELINDDFVMPLAEARHRVVDRFGMAGGSEVLVATAFGERMLNRVWSAAADGHLPEARTSFKEAIAAFRQAHETMQRLAS